MSASRLSVDRVAAVVALAAAWGVLAGTSWAPFDDQLVYLEGTDPRAGRFAGWQDGALLAWWIAAVRLVAGGADLATLNLLVRLGVAALVVGSTWTLAVAAGATARQRAATLGLVTVSLLPVVVFSTDAVLASTLALWTAAWLRGAGPLGLGLATGAVAASRPEAVLALVLLPAIMGGDLRRRVGVAALGAAGFAVLALPGAVAGTGAWEAMALNPDGDRAWYAFRQHYVMLVLEDGYQSREAWNGWRERAGDAFEGLGSFGEMLWRRPDLWLALLVATAPWSVANTVAVLHGWGVAALLAAVRPAELSATARRLGLVLGAGAVTLLPAQLVGFVHQRHVARLIPLAALLAVLVDPVLRARWPLLARVVWGVVALQLLVNLLPVVVGATLGDGPVVVWYVD